MIQPICITTYIVYHKDLPGQSREGSFSISPFQPCCLNLDIIWKDIYQVFSVPTIQTNELRSYGSKLIEKIPHTGDTESLE